MNKKLFLLPLIAAGLFSCSDSVVDSRNDPLSPTASISVDVRDENTSEPIKGATVSVLTLNNGKRTTDAQGRVYYDDVLFGTYRFEVSKEGYAGRIFESEILEPKATGVADASDISSGQSIVQSYYILGNAVVPAVLSPLNAGLDGIVLYYSDAFNTKTAPVKGATIRATVDDVEDWLITQFETKTDDNGYYRFDKLPADQKYIVEILDYDAESVRFKAQTIGTFIGKGISKAVQSNGIEILIDRENTESYFALTSRTLTVSDKDAIEFEFSDDIATALIGKNDITVDQDQVDIAISGNKITITPINSWDVSKDVIKVTFSKNALTLKSTKGVKWEHEDPEYKIDFLPTDIRNSAVGGLKRVYLEDGDSVTHDGGAARLAWNPVAGVTEYVVYGRATRNSKQEWVVLAEVDGVAGNGKTDTTEVVSFGVDDKLDKNGEIEIVVVGKNSRYQTKFAGAATLKVKDEKGPLHDGITVNTAGDDGELIYHETINISSKLFSHGVLGKIDTVRKEVCFNEPLDITKLPAFDDSYSKKATPAVNENGLPSRTKKAVWIKGGSDKCIEVGIILDPITTAQSELNIDLIFKLTAATDEAGNLQRPEYVEVGRAGKTNKEIFGWLDENVTRGTRETFIRVTGSSVDLDAP